MGCSLQGLDRVCLIAVAFANGFDAVIKTSKLELLVQLDCELVDLNVGDNRSLEDAFELQGDDLTEGLATGAAEGEANLVDLLVIGDHVREHGERHLEGGGRLALDLLLDRKVEDLNRDLHVSLLVGESERALVLPWPVSVIEDLKLDDSGHARLDGNDLLRLLLADGASLLPWLLALEVPLLLRALLHRLLDVFEVEVAAAVAHLGHELLDHVLDHVFTTATSTTAATASTSASTASMLAAKGVHHLVDEVLGVFLFLLCSLGVLLVEHGDHDVGGTSVLANLEEGVLVAETLLTLSTVVEVLADTALVAETLDRADTTAITSDILMDDFGLFRSLLSSGQLFTLEKLLEDLLGLLGELIVDEILKSFAGKTLVLLLFLVLLLVACSRLILHLLVGVGGSREGADFGRLQALRLDAEGKFVFVAQCNSEGKIEVVVVLNDDPAVAIVVAK